jgi:polysaccharide pyruvyl transferase WcaK-like protein
MLMKKVVFGGAYGLNSAGDDVALLSLYYGIKEIMEKIECVVLSRHASNDCYKKYGINSIQNMEYQSKAESQGKWFYGFNYNDDRKGLKSIYNQIATSDLLVLGAGNFLADYAIDLLRGPIPYLYILTTMAKMAQVPIMWYGISAGPVRSEYGKRLSLLTADMANVITVRDLNSRELIKSIGYEGEIIVLPDPVLGLPLPGELSPINLRVWRQAHSMSDIVIAVSVRGIKMHTERVYEEYLKTIAAACDYFIETLGAVVIFIPQCCYSHGNPDEDDREVARQVKTHMKYPEQTVLVEQVLGVEECLGLYQGSTFALCTRLHGNVFAAMNGVPSIAVGYNPKVKNFMTWLGKPQLLLNLDELDTSLIVSKAEYIIKNRGQLNQEILNRVREGREQVQQYAYIACGLLNKITPSAISLYETKRM